VEARRGGFHGSVHDNTRVERHVIQSR
jgi:hypothetical protein